MEQVQETDGHDRHTEFGIEYHAPNVLIFFRFAIRAHFSSGIALMHDVFTSHFKGEVITTWRRFSQFKILYDALVHCISHATLN